MKTGELDIHWYDPDILYRIKYKVGDIVTPYLDDNDNYEVVGIDYNKYTYMKM